MELIDKQKLLEWLDNKADARLYDGVYRALIEVFNEIKSGTFDDHSAQEEIAKLKEERDAEERLCKEWISAHGKLLRKYQALEARAIQAEQERDELLVRFNLALTERDGARRAAVEYRKESEQIVKERNALLEGMKKIAEFKKGEALVYVTEIKNIARSIIAKIEGK
ncbi:hypothetical protein [Paenibacillus naphthalenovorans]|uniref:hypothetical protein n=1 Tax=Paenibacillus naphthalenovorans TaxID=162209 RepID=UPI000886A22B|nr:hypothetical protein [Paenibacillus naphthalenovorans]SDJ61708.1 hypothetical protein SAMN05421868_13452 [Paenibacillus naphthalenovorans]